MLCSHAFLNLIFLRSAINVLEKFAQNQSRPEEITLKDYYHNDLLFQAVSFGENIWEIKIVSEPVIFAFLY